MGVRAVMAALPSLINERMNQEIYRIYITDSLQAIAGNTQKYAGGTSLKKRYADIITPKKQDKRTGAEIAADVIKRAGLKVVSKTESI